MMYVVTGELRRCNVMTLNDVADDVSWLVTICSDIICHLGTYFFQGETVTPGPNPPDLISKQLVFLPPVYWDRPVSGLHFGDMIVPPRRKYKLVC